MPSARLREERCPHRGHTYSFPRFPPPETPPPLPPLRGGVPIELTELASALDWQDRIHRGTMLGGSQGWMLAAGVLAVEGGRVSEALAILSAVAALPNPHYQSWAHFFLGLLRQTQARQRVVSDAARESGTVPTSDFTGLTAAFQSYQRSIALARHPHSSSALWARSNAAALAMEFRDDRCAMQLLLPTAKLADQDWEGIAFRMSSGLADGKLHMISMLNTLLKTFLDLSDVESAIPLALKYVAVSGHEASLLALNYSDVLPRDRLAELHHEWGRKMRDHIGPVTRPIPADRGLHRRLKIGYVSSDLKRHPCAYFLEPFLRHHDREAVHVTVYQCNPGGDEYSRKLRGLADEWIEVSHEPERVIAERLRKDTIDIAVELSGHAVVRPFNRSPCHVLAHYAAPVQVSWIGYCNTTGLDCIHYRFVDAVTDHPNTKQWHSERLWRLPDCFLSFAPPQDLLDTPISPLPCIANGLVSFGTFNNLAKICASTMRLWGRLLARLPTAQLKIKGMKGRPVVDEMGNRKYVLDLEKVEVYKERFASVGLDKKADGFNFKSKTNLKRRLHLLPEMHAYSDHFKCYHQIDIALDTFPYCGTTTTIDALMMGVPVITLKSSGAASVHSHNVSASLLMHAGLAELVAETEDDYIRIALELAHDHERLARLRSTLRGTLLQSPLMNGVQAARHVEDAYREMWARFVDETDSS